MSQVNKFNQINNPDYVYFDLQQTNIQNSTEQEQQPLKFLETRETPVIANTGDYYMSVARFQLDTYNLPVFVGEPDLSQTGTYDPDKTIYKVAMNITNGSFTTTANVTAGYNLTTQTTIANTLDLGKSVRTANTGTKDDICVAVSDTGFNAGEGRVFIWRGTTTSNSIAQQLVVNTANAGLGGSTGISDNGTRVVASTTALGSYLWEINNGVVTGATYIAGTGGASTTTISGDGTRIFVGRNLGASGLFALYSYTNSTVTQIGNSRSVGANGYCAKPASLDNTGTNLIVMATNDTSGYIEFIVYVGTTTTYITNFGGAVGDNLGGTVAMSANGTYALATAVRTSGANSFIRVYKRAGSGGTTTWSNITTITSPVANSAGWGKSASMSSDGSTIIVSANNTQTIYIYKRGAGVETYTLYSTVVASNIDVTSVYFESVSINNTGDAFFSAKSPSFTTQGTLYNYTFTDARPSGTVIPVPSSLSSVPTIESVKWIKSIDSATAPTKNSLTGKNTALFSYYYCDNYNSFIAMVNKTFKLAYKNFIERIYNEWIAVINDAGITNQFLDITAVHYPTPPFIDWNETNLTADIYVTLLFETYQSAANAVIDNLNYAMPSTTWAVVSTNNVGTPARNTPLKFEVAFNAPLYSLFSSLPAKRKIITSSTGLKETYYVLNFVSSGLGLVNPSPNLNSVIPYSFLSTYTNSSTGVITIPTANTFAYSNSRLLIKQSQEISTIDTWTPINAIVFTTSSIPIIVNQFTASSSIGSNPPSSSLDNAFDYIITDLQTNQQGYRPNVLYVPELDRKIDLTGNQPLKTIDINVFWRTKTGILVPFTLASGAMSSIKLLFEKKILGEKQKISMASVNVRDIM